MVATLSLAPFFLWVQPLSQTMIAVKKAEMWAAVRLDDLGFRALGFWGLGFFGV